MPLRTTRAGLKLIETAESFAPKVYYDTAHIASAGYGHALTTPTGQQIDADVFGRAKADQLAAEAMQRMFGAQQITLAQAETQLATDVASFESAVNKAVDAKTAQCEFDAMLSFTFNLGPGNFASSTLRKMYLAGQRTIGDISLSDLCRKSKAHAPVSSVAEAFTAWSNSGGAWTLGVFRRRVAEALVFGGHPVDEALKTAWAFHD